LLRRTRLLLSQCDDNPPPLHEGIEQGHISLALLVIEQVASLGRPNGVLEKRNEQGETVLLVGARCKAWEVVEMIAKKRSDLVTDKDMDGNNVLHILASVNEDAGAQTIEKLFAIIPQSTQISLLSEQNKAGETAAESAQRQGNTRCSELLTRTVSLKSEEEA
jgi:ankyrin repeat protein